MRAEVDTDFVKTARLALNPERKNPDPLSALRNRLVFKGSQRHIHPGDPLFPEYIAFLESIRDNRFLQYLHDKEMHFDFATLESTPLSVTLPDRLTESQFVGAPVSTTRTVRECYRDLSPQAASSVAVWNAITLHNIAEGRLKESFLAADSGKEPGHVRIQNALKGVRRNRKRESAKEREKKRRAADGCVRTAFRSMGGLHTSIRGSASVISDCTLSRLWWMGKIVEETSSDLELGIDEMDAWYALNPKWPIIAEWAVKKLTILANPSLMRGLVAHLSECPLQTQKQLRYLLRHIGQEFSTVDLHAWTAAEVRDHLRTVRDRAA